MGLLGNLKKTATVLKDQLEKSGALDKARNAAAGRGAAERGPAEPNATTGTDVILGSTPSTGSDLSNPQTWFTPASVAAITGVTVGEAEYLSSPDAWGVAFTGSDDLGDWRFEMRSVDENVMLSHDGYPSRWIDSQVAGCASKRVVDTFGDYCVAASDRDSLHWCFVWVADSCMVASARTPGIDATKACEKLLRHVYDWPEA